ncbi:MAG: PrgI family protein [Candidatus Daviesbacteria bacterium]|nr:PrgI family protein [Candidatus Daviesbacteria bacterium]
MEPHPIPQNVTSFEFHLVGDMTLKQFAYLGAGLGMAYLLYATMFFSLPIVAIPLILVSTILGVAFAFVPIYDRPFDHWVSAFFKAVYSPTKASFKIKYDPKLKVEPNDPFLKDRLQLYLSTMGMTVNLWDKAATTQPRTTQTQSTPTALQEKEVALAENLISKTMDNIQTQTQPSASEKLPSQQELTNLVEMAKQAQLLQGKISDTENLIKQMTSSTKQAEASQVQSSLKALIQQTEELYKKTSTMNQATPHTAQPQTAAIPQVPSIQAVTQPVAPPKVTVVQPLAHKETQVVLTTTPNIINGMVSDEAGNFIENVIVIIHDKEGIPVRALKTNKLGQFAGATPLPLGVYTITLEKDNFTFQTLQLTLDNSVLGPLQIIAKKGGQ